MKKITVFGGGTGTYVVLSGLKKYPLDLGVVVTMMDSGGSTGRLRDQLKVLPPGDLRQCLLALSEASLLWRKLFLYRFEKGDLAGHNFGNIFLSALEKNCKNYQEVLKTAAFILKIKGEVLPVTFEQVEIGVMYENGKIVWEEKNIDTNYQEKSRIVDVFIKPKNAKTNKLAEKRILDSDVLIIAPGDLYSSVIPIFQFQGIKKAIKKSKAKIVYVMNLMTKSGQTSNYKASDHIFDLEKYLERRIDMIVLNNKSIPQEVINWYQKEGEKPVVDDLKNFNFSAKIIKGDVLDTRFYGKDKNEKFVDKRVRSLLRHDPNKLAKILLKNI